MTLSYTEDLLFSDPAALGLVRDGPHPGEVDLWEIDLTALLACAREHPSAVGVERHATFRPQCGAFFSRTRAAARAALRAVLSLYTSVPDESLLFSCGPFGKPHLHTRHQTDLEFNLSHSGERAVIALASGVQVGVDIEQLRRIADWPSIVTQFFCASESKQLFELEPEIGWRAFLMGWTRKEAFVKATGEGLSRSLSSFDMPVDPKLRSWSLRCTGPPQSDWSMRVLDIEGYACSLAVEGEPRVVRHIAIDVNVLHAAAW